MKLPNRNTLKTLFGFGSFLIYLSFVNILAARPLTDNPPDPSLMFIGSGVKIYSQDSFFNQYLLKSTTDKSNVNLNFDQQENNTLIVIAEKRKQTISLDLSKEVKKAVAKKRAIEIASVKKYITQFEQRKSKYAQGNINLSFPSHFFRVSYDGSWNYIFPNNNQQQFSAEFSENIYFAKQDLYQLYSGLSFLYNSTIVYHCFSIIHTLRPPPAQF